MLDAIHIFFQHGLGQTNNTFFLLFQVNRSPSLNKDSVIDEEVKEQLLVDSLRLINLGRLDKHRVLDEERRRVYQRTQWTIEQRARRLYLTLEVNFNLDSCSFFYIGTWIWQIKSWNLCQVL
jgi:hypothetical protein